MKTVFRDADEVAVVWANRTQEEGRNRSGNCYFHGDTIYSYGSHFPMARFFTRGKQTLVLMNQNDYSATTKGHKWTVQRVLSKQGYDCIEVYDMKPNDKGYRQEFYGRGIKGSGHARNLTYFRRELATRARKYARSRTPVFYHTHDWRRAHVRAIVEDANKYCEFFNLKTRFEDEQAINEAKVWVKQERSRVSKLAWKQRKEMAETIARVEAEERLKHELEDRRIVASMSRAPGRRLRIVRRN